MNKQIKILQVSQIFKNEKYEIPIYQRNYAWEDKQIHQLIDDIYTSQGTYFLGNMIVNQKDSGVYELIDGQQRLTTLYLLQTYLKMNVLKGSLYFEAREKSNRTLLIVGSEQKKDVLDELQSEEINNGYRIIEDYFKSAKINSNKFRQKLDNVQLIRIQVPQNIDLNHYFEIMNTRGEQLEFHEIAKAKLLSKLSTNEDKKVGALIWDACSNMDTYVQMNFDSKTRNSLFSDNWSKLNSKVTDFDKIRERVTIKNEDSLINGSKTLLDILENPELIKNSNTNTTEENERFESIISFPNFILQVNKAICKSNENESMLDDKNFLKNIELNWENEKTAKDFLYNLLKYRVLFDKYILKREFVKDYKESGKWSLQRLESYKDNKNESLKPKYVGTFSDDKNKQIRTLQSCLRVTYTSPKTMHWISILLKSLADDENVDVLNILEEYCKNKVKESDYENSSGFDFQRIVFTYLDYILYRDGYSYKCEDGTIVEPLKEIKQSKDEWQFQFRNSIEHFYPQNPINIQEYMKWDYDDSNGFGNLALITVSGNARFSNLPPEAKVVSDKSIFNQSLKLRIMKSMIDINNGVWNQEISKIHKREMFEILNKEISR